MSATVEEYRQRLREALQQIHEMEEELDAVTREQSEPIAIIGMACRLPGGIDSPESFHERLVEGFDAIGEVPADRWTAAQFSPKSGLANERAIRWGAFLKDIDLFDASFFGISPREANSMDPQQRLLLMVAWEAIERAGQRPDQLNGSLTGVFIGLASNDYMLVGSQRDPYEFQLYDTTGNGHCFPAGRISYVLGLRGPCFAVDTACSSSLVATHLACQSLRLRECNLALAGGAHLMISPVSMAMLAKSQGLSPDGRCKTFDASANGFVRGEGLGIVVLKRLADAQRDGDPILAVIRGSSINQDGLSAGFTAPNGEAQRQLLRQALTNAELNPEDIGYIETHGTGTSLGDPIEADALKSVFGQPRQDGSSCVLGAVKTNLGHLEGAAGIASLIKTINILQHSTIPKNLHFRALNPRISFSGTPIVVPREAISWPRGGKPRRAGVSAFGMSGTNAHLVLEEAPIEETSANQKNDSYFLLPISAKSANVLKSQSQAYAQWLPKAAALDIEDIVYTAGARRVQHEHRIGVIGRSHAELAQALSTFAQNESSDSVVFSANGKAPDSRVVFVFPGQGSQWLGMGRQLLAENTVFKAAIEECADAMHREAGFSILHELTASEANSRLNDIDVAQPMIFAMQVALARVWQSWGITPSCVIGHSMGEVAAAHVAGILDLNDAIKIICRRSRILKRIRGQGAMALVELPVQEAAEAIQQFASQLSVAVSNGPRATVLSGDPRALESVLQLLEHRGVFCRRVKVDVASHSPQVDPLRSELLTELRSVQPRQSEIRMHSTVTGQPVKGPELDVEYWWQNLRQPVLFSDVTRALIRDENVLFLEISPHPILLPAIEENLRDLKASGAALGSLRRLQDEQRSLLHSLATLYVQGVDFAWEKVNPAPKRVVGLPNYCWQKKRYWLDLPNKATDTSRNVGIHPLLGFGLVPALHTELHVWEQRLSVDAFPYLADHQVQGEFVFPGTGYVELTLAAAKQFFREGAIHIETLALEQMLSLTRSGMRILQTSLEDENHGRATITISSREHNENDWIRHAFCSLRLMHDGIEPARIRRADFDVECTEVMDVGVHYDRMKARGLLYGDTFRGVAELHLGTGRALARIELPKTIDDADAHVIHPALLDACFQAASWALESNNGNDTFVPVELRGIHLYRRPEKSLWIHARALGTSNKENPEIAIEIFDDAGEMILRVDTLRARRLPNATSKASDPFADCVFELMWRKQDLDPLKNDSVDDRRPWVILADVNGWGQTLGQYLRTRGNRVIIVKHGSKLMELGDGIFSLDSESIEDWQRLLTLTCGKLGCRGVISCSALDATQWSDINERTLYSDLRRGPWTALRLVQAILKQNWRDTPRFYIVTRGTQSVDAADTSASISQSTLWGLGRVIAMEQPDLGCVRVDLPLVPDADDFDWFSQELMAQSEDDQVAWRGTGRFVARLARRTWSELGGASERQEFANGRPFRLETREPGVLERLALRPFNRIPPGPGEVEVEVEAAGLNFIDVLKAMGIYPGMDPTNLRFGGECAGRIVALGQGVTEFDIGQSVIASAPASLATHVIAKAKFVIPKPEGLSFAQAATIPAVFTTVHWALHRLAQLKSEERILIHSAAGGTGLAAIQYAQFVGAEIFATAGSEEKRAFLRSLGIRHVLDSRTLAFADEIMNLTEGRGVDIVLNSLTGEAAIKSLELLASYGRFLELGKKDIYQNLKLGMLPFRKSLSYTAIDLAGMMVEKPALYGQLLEDVIDGFKSGMYKPQPLTVIEAHAVESAFRTMAQARHIGKIAITMKDTAARLSMPVEEVRIRRDATYLITGGLGGLGLSLAGWLIEQGATSIALMSRNGPSASVRVKIDAWRATGATVRVFQADVSQYEEVHAVLDAIDQTMLPLRGVVHSAVVLDDRTIAEMGEEQFFRPMDAKVLGGWNLHAATSEIPLDFFVMYSSASGLIGSPGQSNYAAANTFLDALCRARKARGLPATSIQWGAFSEVGQAAAQDVRGKRLATRGNESFTPSEGHTLFSRILRQSRPEVGLMRFDVRQWVQFYPQMAGAPFFAEIKDEKTPPGGHSDSIRESLTRASPSERHNLIENHLLNQVGQVLRLDSQQIDKRSPFTALGMDSLMSLELRNRLEATLDIKLSAALLFTYPNVLALADFILQKIGFDAPAPSEVAIENKVEEDQFPDDILLDTEISGMDSFAEVTDDDDDLLNAFDESAARIRRETLR